MTTEYRGQVEVSALTRAYKLLCRRYPVLRGRVQKTGSHYVLEVTPDDQSGVAVFSGGKDKWFAESSKIAKTLRPALAKLLLVHNRDGGYLVLAHDHLIADGHAIFEYLSELWKLYTTVIEKGDVGLVKQGTLPAAPSEILRARWGIDNPPNARDITADGLDGTPEKWLAQPIDIYLNRDETSMLVGTARTRGITVGAYIIGAMATILRARSSAKGSIPMAFAVGVDQRNTVSPSIKATETTHLVSPRTVRLEISQADDVVAVGRRFRSELQKVVNQRDEQLLLTQKDPEQLVKSLTRRSHACMLLNNVGSVPMFQHPDSLTLVRLVVPDLLPEGRGGKPLEHFWPYMLISYTFNGELMITWLGNDEDDQIRARFVEKLRSVNGRH